MVESVDELRESLERHGIRFEDTALMRTALTHRSYLNERPGLDWEDNERLEYLGDAVLDFVLAEYLYLHLPNVSEGELTGIRASLVRRETLARFAQELELGTLLFMGHGEADSGGRERPATLCAAYEALAGALYLDQGLAGVNALVIPMAARELATAQALVFSGDQGSAMDQRDRLYKKDPKSRLQEFAQGTLGVTPRYRTVKTEGPDHARTFTVEVMIGDMACGEGEGPSKQAAAQQAAADALAKMTDWTTSLAAPIGSAGPSGDAGSHETR